jgi:DNA-binding SARP family transcriptional activator
MTIKVFGPLRVHSDDVALATAGVAGRKPRQVLQILAAHPGSPVSRDRLIDLLWESGPPADPVGAIEHYVAQLRRGLRGRTTSVPSVVRSESAGYRLDLDRVQVDLAEFTAAADDLRTWLSIDRVRDALAISRAELFEDEPDADWASETRDEVRRRRCTLLVRAAELDLAAGDPLAAVRDASRAIQTDPHDESAHRALMCAYYVRGDQERALAAYRSCRVRLVADLGTEPAAHTRSMHEAVLRQGRIPDVLRRLTLPEGLRSA